MLRSKPLFLDLHFAFACNTQAHLFQVMPFADTLQDREPVFPLNKAMVHVDAQTATVSPPVTGHQVPRRHQLELLMHMMMAKLGAHTEKLETDLAVFKTEVAQIRRDAVLLRAAIPHEIRCNLPPAGFYVQRVAQARGLVTEDQSLLNRSMQLEKRLKAAHKDLAVTQEALRRKVEKLAAATAAVPTKQGVVLIGMR